LKGRYDAWWHIAAVEIAAPDLGDGVQLLIVGAGDDLGDCPGCGFGLKVDCDCDTEGRVGSAGSVVNVQIFTKETLD